MKGTKPLSKDHRQHILRALIMCAAKWLTEGHGLRPCLSLLTVYNLGGQTGWRLHSFTDQPDTHSACSTTIKSADVWVKQTLGWGHPDDWNKNRWTSHFWAKVNRWDRSLPTVASIGKNKHKTQNCSKKYQPFIYPHSERLHLLGSLAFVHVYVMGGGLIESTVLLPQPPKGWDCRSGGHVWRVTIIETIGAGEMAQRLRAGAAHADVLSMIPCTNV